MVIVSLRATLWFGHRAHLWAGECRGWRTYKGGQANAVLLDGMALPCGSAVCLDSVPELLTTAETFTEIAQNATLTTYALSECDAGEEEGSPPDWPTVTLPSNSRTLFARALVPDGTVSARGPPGPPEIPNERSGEQLKPYWYVKRVIAEQSGVTAELVGLEWFTRNPAYDAMEEEYQTLVDAEGEEAADAVFMDREMPDEFIDCEPTDEGALNVPAAGQITVDVTDGPALMPGQLVRVSLELIETPEGMEVGDEFFNLFA